MVWLARIDATGIRATSGCGVKECGALYRFLFCQRADSVPDDAVRIRQRAAQTKTDADALVGGYRFNWRPGAVSQLQHLGELALLPIRLTGHCTFMCPLPDWMELPAIH